MADQVPQTENQEDSKDELKALLEERIKAQTAQRVVNDILLECLSDLELRIKLDSATRGVNLVYRGSNEYLSDVEQCLTAYLKVIEDKIEIQGKPQSKQE